MSIFRRQLIGIENMVIYETIFTVKFEDNSANNKFFVAGTSETLTAYGVGFNLKIGDTNGGPVVSLLSPINVKVTLVSEQGEEYSIEKSDITSSNFRFIKHPNTGVSSSDHTIYIRELPDGLYSIKITISSKGKIGVIYKESIGLEEKKSEKVVLTDVTTTSSKNSATCKCLVSIQSSKPEGAFDNKMSYFVE